MKVGVFHPGTQHSWQTARALADLDLLSWYLTSIFYVPDRLPYSLERVMPEKMYNAMHSEFMRFYHPALDPKLVLTHGADVWLERIFSRSGLRKAAKYFNSRGNSSLGVPLTRLFKTSPIDTLWGYDTTSLEGFNAANREGVKCVLDKTIGHPRIYNNIMQTVYDQYSEFFLDRDFAISSQKIDRQDAEMTLADTIIVGSPFCKDTLIAGRPDITSKIRVLPYCFDDKFYCNTAFRQPRPVGYPVRFIFVGQAGPRKGIHLLLKAFSRLPKSAASLTILGELQIPKDEFARYSSGITHLATVPRAKVAELMRESDCLVFPSLFEGGGIVLYEALASGLGIIQSANADIAASEGTGIILYELNETSLYDALMNVVENPIRLNEWKENAPARSLKYSYFAYRDGVANALREK